MCIINMNFKTRRLRRFATAESLLGKALVYEINKLHVRQTFSSFSFSAVVFFISLSNLPFGNRSFVFLWDWCDCPEKRSGRCLWVCGMINMSNYKKIIIQASNPHYLSFWCSENNEFYNMLDSCKLTYFCLGLRCKFGNAHKIITVIIMH